MRTSSGSLTVGVANRLNSVTLFASAVAVLLVTTSHVWLNNGYSQSTTEGSGYRSNRQLWLASDGQP